MQLPNLLKSIQKLLYYKILSISWYNSFLIGVLIIIHARAPIFTRLALCSLKQTKY